MQYILNLKQANCYWERKITRHKGERKEDNPNEKACR